MSSSTNLRNSIRSHTLFLALLDREVLAQNDHAVRRLAGGRSVAELGNVLGLKNEVLVAALLDVLRSLTLFCLDPVFRTALERLPGRFLKLQGLGCDTIAEKVGRVPATVVRAVNRFLRDGEDGLEERRSENGVAKVDADLLEILFELLGESPEDCGYLRSTWLQELLSDVLQEKTLGPGQSHHDWPYAGDAECAPGKASPDGHLPLSIAQKTQRIRRLQKLIDKLPKNAVIVYGTAEKKDSDLVIRLLARLKKVYPRARRSHPIFDNYSIHSGKKVQIASGHFAKNLVLDFLPPYSPRHNQIDKLWKQDHDKITRNHKCWAIEQLLEKVQAVPGACVTVAGLAALVGESQVHTKEHAKGVVIAHYRGQLFR